jgi:trehalose-6-phosphate synthase
MNLVAKEYVASQVDLNGALLVSEFAGSAEEIPGAISINPYDTEGCADAIKNALETKSERRRESMERARWYIKEKNIYRWVEDVLKELKTIG